MRSLPPQIKLLPFVVAGILLGQVLHPDWWVTAASASLFTLLAYRLRSRWQGSLYMAAAILLWALCTTSLRTPHTVPKPHEPQEWEAKIVSEPIVSGRWQRCDAQISLGSHTEKIILQADTSNTIALGEKGIVYGYLNPLPEGSYGELMSRRGYVGQIWATDKGDWRAEGESHTLGITARKMQQRLVERIEQLGLKESEEAIVEAMLLGWKGGISRDMRSDYSRAGASHLLAISGLHVGIVAMLVWWLLWLLPLTSRRGHIVRNIVAVGIMLLYGVITGLSPSVVRATVMFCIAQMALINGSARSSVNLLAGAVNIMLLVNPNNLFDISFTLSAVAVMGITIGFSPTMHLFGGESSNRWLRALKGVVVVGLTSTIATLPLVAHTFGTVSLVGIFLNPIMIVTAEIIVLMGFIWVTLPLDFLAPLFKAVIGGAASLQNRIAEGAADLPWAAWDVDLPDWMVAMCYLLMATGVVVASVWKEKKEWKVRS